MSGIVEINPGGSPLPVGPRNRKALGSDRKVVDRSPRIVVISPIPDGTGSRSGEVVGALLSLCEMRHESGSETFSLHNKNSRSGTISMASERDAAIFGPSFRVAFPATVTPSVCPLSSRPFSSEVPPLSGAGAEYARRKDGEVPTPAVDDFRFELGAPSLVPHWSFEGRHAHGPPNAVAETAAPAGRDSRGGGPHFSERTG